MFKVNNKDTKDRISISINKYLGEISIEFVTSLYDWSLDII